MHIQPKGIRLFDAGNFLKAGFRAVSYAGRCLFVDCGLQFGRVCLEKIEMILCWFYALHLFYRCPHGRKTA